jgi:hypothetical protein
VLAPRRRQEREGKARQEQLDLREGFMLLDDGMVFLLR